MPTPAGRRILWTAALLFATLSGILSGQTQKAETRPRLGFQDVYGIELNVLEEAGEFELILMSSHFSRRGSSGVFECEYAFNRWFSLEVEVPWRYEHPAFSGFELEGTFSLIRKEDRGFLAVGGIEAFLPTGKRGGSEWESYIGLVKSFPSFSLLAKLSFAWLENEASETDIKDDGDLSLAVGPYFPLGRNVFLGLPLVVGSEREKWLFKAGVDLNIQIAAAFRIFILGFFKTAEKTDWTLSLGCFLEID